MLQLHLQAMQRMSTLEIQILHTNQRAAPPGDPNPARLQQHLIPSKKKKEKEKEKKIPSIFSRDRFKPIATYIFI